MATKFKPNKRGVVTGTSKADRITWMSTKDWAKAITVNAGKGNDVIDFRKSRYRNRLNGQDGNDTIYGGTNADTINGGNGNDKLFGYNGNDIIYGGKGNDTINAGRGTNTIYINKNEGTDAILNGGGNDTIVFAQEHNFNSFMFYYVGNDLIFTAGNSTANLKNFALGGHSAKYIQAGNQKLKLSGQVGTAENDLIVSTANNDVINGGAGNNTIYHNAGNGNDTIQNGGGVDTIVLTGVNSVSDLTAAIAGNDVVITRPNGEQITLENALPAGHSVKYIQIGDNIYGIDTLKNTVNSAEQVVNGTAWHDDIYTSFQHVGYDYATVNAGAGNDVIHITNESDAPQVHLGAGNDAVSLEASKPSVSIYFGNGDGNNTISGLTNTMNTTTQIKLYSSDLIRSVDLGTNITYNYLLGTNSGNDRIFNLTGGETLTIENYNGVNDIRRGRFYIYDGVRPLQQLRNFKFIAQENIVNLSSTLDTYTETGSGKFIFAPDIEDARTITLSGSGNELIVKGGATQTVNIAGDNSVVYVYNTGSTTGDTTNTVNIASNNNEVHISGGNQRNVNMEENLTGNVIKIYDGGWRNVYTSEGGSTTVESSNTNNSGSNYIYSRGTDTIDVKKEFHNLYLQGNYDKIVMLRTESKNCDIFDMVGVSSANITKELQSPDTPSVSNTPKDIMFEHYKDNNYAAWAIRSLYINYLAEDGTLLNSGTNKLCIQGSLIGGVFDLDTAEFFNKVNITVQDNYNSVTKKLSQMRQYVNLNRSCYNDTLDAEYDHHFVFDEKDQNLLVDNRAGVYIAGSDANDLYSNYTFDIGQVTINDAGDSGTYNRDVLSLDMARADFRFFIDIDKNGNAASNDLIIYHHSSNSIQEDGLFQYLSGNNVDNYIEIKNQRNTTWADGVGAIESINDNDNDDGYDINALFGHIKNDVASWIVSYNTAHGTSFDTVSEAIANQQTSLTELTNLYNIYCIDAYHATL